MATATETFPVESHVPRSFVDYQLARSAQTRYVLGSLHSDAELAAGTDLSRHFTRAPAQPTAWSSGQATVLPWREVDARRDMAARNVQRIYRGQSRSFYEMAKAALAVHQREADEFAEMMRTVNLERKQRAAAATQIQAIRSGARERRQLALTGELRPGTLGRLGRTERDALAADAELDPLIAKVRAEQRKAQQSVINHHASLKALADAPLVTDADRAAAVAAAEARDQAMYLGRREGAGKEAASKAVMGLLSAKVIGGDKVSQLTVVEATPTAGGKGGKGLLGLLARESAPNAVAGYHPAATAPSPAPVPAPVPAPSP